MCSSAFWIAFATGLGCAALFSRRRSSSLSSLSFLIVDGALTPMTLASRYPERELAREGVGTFKIEVDGLLRGENLGGEPLEFDALLAQESERLL